MTYAKLRVVFSKEESSDFFINQISCGWDKWAARYWVKSYSGTYYFDVKTRKVTLDDGVRVIEKEGVTFTVLN